MALVSFRPPPGRSLPLRRSNRVPGVERERDSVDQNGFLDAGRAKPHSGCRPPGHADAAAGSKKALRAVRVADLDTVPSWFVVLDDHESPGPVGAALRARATGELSHPSGRPWLLGCWPEGTMTTGQAGHTKLAVIGQHAVTPGQLTDAAARIRAVADLDGLAASLVGSCHLVASVAGRVRVQGTVTGVRRVFHASIGGAAVAADRADVLAGLLDAGLDEQRLALHLLEPHILYPLAGQPVWQGVAVLPTDHYLVLDGDGRHRTVRSWTPPEPVVPMAEGAPALREALSAAVASRVRGRELVSCDLGGLDSTSVCSLAAQRGLQGGGLHRGKPGSPGRRRRLGCPHGGRARQRRAPHHPSRGDAAALPRSPCDGRPAGRAVQRRRGPRAMADHRPASRGPRFAAAPDRLRRGRTVVRLVGPPAFHAAVQPQDRPTAAAWLRRQVPVATRPDAAAAVGHQPLSDWLARVAETLTAPPPPPEEPLLDWGFTPRLPPWATPAAVAGGAGADPRRGPRHRTAGHGSGPAPGAGGDAVRVPHHPPVRADGRAGSGSRSPPPTTTTG